jgi:hypothetical protein
MCGDDDAGRSDVRPAISRMPPQPPDNLLRRVATSFRATHRRRRAVLHSGSYGRRQTASRHIPPLLLRTACMNARIFAVILDALALLYPAADIHRIRPNLAIAAATFRRQPTRQDDRLAQPRGSATSRTLRRFRQVRLRHRYRAECRCAAIGVAGAAMSSPALTRSALMYGRW